MNAIILFLGGVGFNEILVIAVFALIFFGSKQIPEFMKGIGNGVREFKNVMGDVQKEVNKVNDDVTKL